MNKCTLLGIGSSGIPNTQRPRRLSSLSVWKRHSHCSLPQADFIGNRIKSFWLTELCSTWIICTKQEECFWSTGQKGRALNRNANALPVLGWQCMQEGSSVAAEAGRDAAETGGTSECIVGILNRLVLLCKAHCLFLST